LPHPRPSVSSYAPGMQRRNLCRSTRFNAAAPCWGRGRTGRRCPWINERIATCGIAELQIAHWPLLCVSMALANSRVLQFAILKFCKLQFFYEIPSNRLRIPSNVLGGSEKPDQLCKRTETKSQRHQRRLHTVHSVAIHSKRFKS
jgi:hypothetical protein